MLIICVVSFSTQGYLIYLKKRLQDGPSPLSFNRDDLLSLFGNIEHICEFNSSLLSHLEDCGLDPVKIASCFVDKSAGFHVYTQYCTNYPK